MIKSITHFLIYISLYFSSLNLKYSKLTKMDNPFCDETLHILRLLRVIYYLYMISYIFCSFSQRENESYSLNKQEWICSLFKELEKRGITQGFRVIPEVTPKWVNNTNVHSKFTLISLFSKIHSLKSEHIHSFLFRDYRLKHKMSNIRILPIQLNCNLIHQPTSELWFIFKWKHC